MLWRDPVVREKEVYWHSLDQVLQTAPPSPDMTAMIVDPRGIRHLNGVFGSVVDQAAGKRGQLIRWRFILNNPELFEGRHANGVEVKTENLRMMTSDRRRSQQGGTMWLFVMDGYIKPSEFFIKILQHYQMYTPAFAGTVNSATNVHSFKL